MTPSQENNPGICPRCNSPLSAGAKFCESCGKPVAAPAPVEVKTPAPQPKPAAAASEKTPDKKTPERSNETAKKIPDKAPASNTQTLVIAGVVGLVIVVALAWFMLMPMLSGSGTTSGGAIPTPTTAVSGTTAQSSASASFVPEPTQVPPTNLLITYQAERDPITGLVTVTFTGGPGKNGVSDLFIKLTRSDGQVLTQSFKPQQIGSFTTLQGTKMTDRIELIANYYNGDKYRIIDQLFEYK
jgi:hypothetical protein